MSNRSLFEINHDFGHAVADRPTEFGAAMRNFLASNSERNAEELKRFGVRVIGTRHHTEGFDITFGCHQASEKGTS